jgi:hypothetical protein
MFHFDWGIFWPLVIVGGVLGWLILEEMNGVERDLRRDLQQVCTDLREIRITLNSILRKIGDTDGLDK